jgi:hypothetical protein
VPSPEIMPSYDIALTEAGGVITLHDAYCPQARTMALLGYPVATLLGCERVPDDYPMHPCMDHYGLHDQGLQSRPESTK